MSDRLARALALIDAANREDPRGRELHYGERMSARLAALEPDASEALQIACRAQHIRRWEVPRDTYPEGRAGYKKWRADLARRHGAAAASIALEAGYDDEVSALVRKQRLRSDPEAQTLEDVACLVFLEHYLGDFAAKHPREKVVDIIAKSAAKMSDRGLAAIADLDLSPEQRALIDEAVR
jgi:hypothetical protein